MILINSLTTLLTINEFISSVLLPFLNKLEELKLMKEGTQQIQSFTYTNLMIPQTPVPIDTEALNFIAQETHSIVKTTEAIQDMAGF
jgi:hypothetical protein